MDNQAPILSGPGPKPVLVLGTDDIASAVGHVLAGFGIATLLVRDPDVPVVRRGMSFDDALEYGSVRLDGLTARASGLPPAGPVELLTVTGLRVEDVLKPSLVDGVIDARMRRRQHKADLRGVLGFAIGLGPGFVAGGNVDIAVETAPEAAGLILREGPTIPAHGKPVLLGKVGAKRFVRAPRAGVWWTFREIGEPIEAGAVVGLCAGMQIPASLGGHLRGLVRCGTDMRVGMRLLEIDPRGGDAQCHGISPHAATIAAACLTAVHEIWRAPQPAARKEAVTWLT